jgi:hypothetical protein
VALLCANICCGRDSDTSRPVRATLTFMPFSNLPETAAEGQRKVIKRSAEGMQKVTARRATLTFMPFSNLPDTAAEKVNGRSAKGQQKVCRRSPQGVPP